MLAALGGKGLDPYSQLENLGFLTERFQDIVHAYQNYQALDLKDSTIFDTAGNVQTAFLNRYLQSQYWNLDLQLGLNSLTGSEPYDTPADTRFLLWHYSGDDLVPPQNTIDMVNYLKASGHQAERAGCHENSAYTDLVLKFSHDPLKKHVVCALFYLDGIYGEMPPLSGSK
jgi:hypothetical protein